MPKINFAKVDDMDDFSPVPEDTYQCRLSEVEEASTQHGDEMWKLKFEIAEGDYSGRYLFDNMVFSTAALKRAKLICSRLGLDTSREVDLTPDMLIGCSCYLTIEIEEYEDQEGKTKKRNIVPFAGYERVEGSPAQSATPADSQGENEEDDNEDEIPF